MVIYILSKGNLSKMYDEAKTIHIKKMYNMDKKFKVMLFCTN